MNKPLTPELDAAGRYLSLTTVTMQLLDHARSQLNDAAV